MRFKAKMDLNQFFYMGIVFLFPFFIGYEMFNTGNMVFAVLFWVLTAAVLMAILIDVLRSAYIFEDERIVYNALVGGEKIAYGQIVQVAIRKNDKGLHVYMHIGRKNPHKVKVVDPEGFLKELFVRRPELDEGADRDEI